MALELADETAVVTGAGAGIGRATAERFAEEGANVETTVRTAVDTYGSLDVAHNNAGIEGGDERLAEVSEAD
jgi:NAD(P)-dependent dehydrogenase (short-subunit alcohol dehydrogenase family)